MKECFAIIRTSKMYPASAEAHPLAVSMPYCYSVITYMRPAMIRQVYMDQTPSTSVDVFAGGVPVTDI
jgi:hypothetical protein